MKKSVVIVGGSIAGLTAALVLASAKNKELDFEITIIDEGKADLKNVAIYNVAMFPRGVEYKEIIEHTKRQIDSMLHVKYVDGEVTDISGSKGSLHTKGSGIDFKSDYVILATGAGHFNIKGLGDIVKPHNLMNKPNKIRLEWSGRQQVKDGVYVAGLASGVTTMVGAAIGSATEAACAILSDIKGEVAIVHDVPSSREVKVVYK
ncbi:NAD(P)/FAD-dependent oxidoreductase [Helicobacter saguini]|uniref:NAD(P)/FAD-dependent oxidoreductase n=1 Tax=Helicobacter saguini TaxID=1548018 RepID=A0A099BA11_9HELI|nr:FAD-dependent oxidoreductase [Helicobacter saguini]MWV60964.1 NAD(P)/FAD-dependent oxidoreductase [Helicobacter saguini]MWV68368.1 NAD(P)/FAD-dependent oxidoreductase [Helicobacter saguini]MWV70168.1 NAD(P)/FAD-dependent oxidoreductase [Helicobacter saguini]MWV72071.1 NAD(P)/FAD-dependent oxidoreductase [Helicobacter saguini]TLD93708.1 NAD(P)/FAD-dependent oxidoreductase [Helicobacter saguini]